MKTKSIRIAVFFAVAFLTAGVMAQGLIEIMDPNGCSGEAYPEATYCFVDGNDCCVD